MIWENILKLIGSTPLVKLNRLNPNSKVIIAAKLEYFNPAGSIKDRVALSMIEAAEQSGELTKEKIIIEATSGNTGIGLAMVAAVKGYKILLIMPESASLERRKILMAFGAKLLLTPARLGTDGAIEEAYRLAREEPEKYFLPDQFNNPYNIEAHYRSTAQEIWNDTDGKVDMVVAPMGTSGTLMGLSRRLKELKPDIKIVGVEPFLGHKIQGLKNMKESYVPGIFNRDMLDQVVNIEDDIAYDTARKLAKLEGLFVGMSSGASIAAAIEIARSIDSGIIVAICPDGGERYLSTPLFQIAAPSSIKFYNTLNRKKEPFTPIEEKKVRIYSCGPTMDSLLHLGHCRRIVFADLLVRYLEYRGFTVEHIMNLTDLDDRTIEGAFKNKQELKTFTDKYIKEFFKDLPKLNVKKANRYPLASEHVEEMIKITEKLLSRGMAYEKLRSVYFDIHRLKDYGELSKIDLDRIEIGKTVDMNTYEKDNPHDFTLLKRSTLAELKTGIYFDSPWGKIRPGWHIECIAMSMKYLGEQFDIHTGSRDLIFPHHENELAISKALTGVPLAKYWLHCDLVYLNGKKISHRFNNMLTLQDLENMGFNGREIRFWLLATHYRKPLNFNPNALEQAKKQLQRLDYFVNLIISMIPGKGNSFFDQYAYDVITGFKEAMDDDLNLSKGLGTIYRFIRRINHLLLKGDKPTKKQKEKLINTLKEIDSVIAVLDFSLLKEDRLLFLINKREELRKKKEYEKADAIRNEIKGKGYDILDTSIGSVPVKIS